MYPGSGSNSDDPINRDDSSLDESWRDIAPSRHHSSASDSARSSARALENSALKNQKTGGKSDLDTARSAEKPGHSDSNFISNVTGQKKDKKSFLKFLLNKKRLGPFGAIIAILGFAGSIIISSQSLAPFALVANGLDQFNFLRTSMNRRSDYFMRFALGRGNYNKATVGKKYFGVFGPDHFKISSKIQKKLAKNNISYVDDADGKGLRILVYKAPDGQYSAIAANPGDAAKIPDRFKLPDGTDVELPSAFSKWELGDAMDNIEGFRTNMDISTRTTKGHIAGWFDSVSEKFHNRIQNSRNRFSKTKSDATADEVVADAKKTGLKEEIPESDSDRVTHVEENPDYDPKDPNSSETITVKTKDAPDALTKNMANTSDIQDALNSRVKVAATAAAASNLMCAAMKAMSAVNSAISAIHVANVINYVTGLLNAIQQAQIDGNGGAMNYYFNQLSQRSDTYDVTGDEPLIKNTSAMESPAYAQFFGGPAVSAASPMAKKFNKDYVAEVSMSDAGVPPMIAQVSSFGSSADAYKFCIAAQAAAGVASIATLALDIASFGFTAAMKGAITDLVQAAKIPIIVTALGAVISAITPHVAKWLAMDLIKNMAGEDAAYAINSGFNMYLGQQMQASSGLPGNKDQVVAQYRETQAVIAREAEVERSMKSPFDITSKNTFLGSIIHSAIPLGFSLQSPLKTLSGTVGLFGSSVRSLLPAVSAASDQTWYNLSLNENCPSLSQIGLVGDAFCNPYFVSDFSTVSMDPGEVYENIDSSNFSGEDSNGNPQIAEKSELSKWVVACAVRQPQFGTVDAGIITTSLSGNSAVDSAISLGLNFVPVIGDVADVVDSGFQAANLPWATGENCINSKYKYFSRYSEDQRMMEAMGIIDKSSVTAFLEKYEKEHPVDNSTEGIIARYSGMTKEQVKDTLGLIAYFNFVAKYDPSDSGPIKKTSPRESYQHESSSIIAEILPDVTNPKYIIYDDYRSRIKTI